MDGVRHLADVLAACLILGTAHSFAVPLNVSPDLLHDLRSQRAGLDVKVKELNESTRQVEHAQVDSSSVKAALKLHEAQSKKARAKLEEIQTFVRNNPGELAPDRLRAAEEEHRNAGRVLKDAEEKLAAIESRIDTLSALAIRLYTDIKRMQKTYEGDVDREVDRQLQERIRALQVSKVIEVSAQVSCGEESITLCKERSKKAAELKASEQGSVVFVNSLTEVKNFKLTKEELRSEVRATLSDEKILSQSFVGDSGFETKISVRVEPAISESLREQMAGSIRAGIYAMAGGRIDYARVKKPFFTELRADESNTPLKNTPAVQTVSDRTSIESSASSNDVFRNRTLLIKAKSLSVTPIAYGQDISTSDFNISATVEIENISQEDFWVGVTSLKVGACKIDGFGDFAGVAFVHGDESYADFKQIKNGSSEDRRNILTALPAGTKTVLIAQSNSCGRNGMLSLSGKTAPFSADLHMDVEGKYQRLSAVISEFPLSSDTHREH